MASQQQVRALHDKNPRATAEDIARELDCCASYVRATARRLGLCIKASNRPASTISLGEAARAAGMTLEDIRAWAKQRKEIDQ